MKSLGATIGQPSSMQVIRCSVPVLILLTAYALQQDLQNLWLHCKAATSIGDLSEQTRHSHGSSGDELEVPDRLLGS